MQSILEEVTGLSLWTLFLAFFVWSLLLAVVLTWPVCALVLASYRRSVRAGMSAAAGSFGAPVADAPPPAGPPRHIGVAEAGAGPPGALVVEARRRVRRAQVAYAAAGLVCGLGLTVVYHLVSGNGWAPLPFLLDALLLSWLVVPTLITVGIPDRRVRAMAWAGYLVAVVVVALAAGPGTAQVLGVAFAQAAVPGAFVVATAAPMLRGAAWLVAPAIAALGLTVAAGWPPLVVLWYGVPLDPSTRTLLVVAVATPLLVVLYGAAVALLYARKWAGDKTLLILQWWLVQTGVLALLLGTQGMAAAAWAFAPFALMLLVLLGVALAQRRGRDDLPARLLLLRTFGDRGRSSRLFRDLTVHWRWVGSVELITGPDLATELLEPHEFLDYLRGRLRRHFVRDTADLTRRLAELDLRPDLDGRYRVNEMLCHDDTWRPTLQALVPAVDAVLIDLRGLTPQRTGVLHEIERVVALLPLDRVVALTGRHHGRARAAVGARPRGRVGSGRRPVPRRPGPGAADGGRVGPELGGRRARARRRRPRGRADPWRGRAPRRVAWITQRAPGPDFVPLTSERRSPTHPGAPQWRLPGPAPTGRPSIASAGARTRSRKETRAALNASGLSWLLTCRARGIVTYSANGSPAAHARVPAAMSPI